MYSEVFDSPMAVGAVMLRQAAASGVADNGIPIGSDVIDFICYNGVNHLLEFVASMGHTCKLQGSRSAV
jgi:hypothetical protein